LGRKCVQFELFSPISQYLDDVRLRTNIFGYPDLRLNRKKRRSNRIRINCGLLYVQ